MPAIQLSDLVNKTDERIVLEPGDSIEVQTVQVSKELRIEQVMGDE